MVSWGIMYCPFLTNGFVMYFFASALFVQYAAGVQGICVRACGLGDVAQP